MSENAARSYSDTSGVPKQAGRPGPRSVWISHWMSSTSCSTMKQAHGRLSMEEENHETKQLCLLEGPDKAQNMSEGDEKTGRMTDSNLVGNVEDNLVVKSEKVRSSFPMFSLQRKGDNALTQKSERSSGFRLGNSGSQTDNYSESRRLSLFGDEKQLKNSKAMVKWVSGAETKEEGNILESKEEDAIAENKMLSLERLNASDLVASSSVPRDFDHGKTMVRSVRKREEINRSNSVLQSGERVTNTASNKRFQSPNCEDSTYNLFGRSRSSLARHSDTDLMPLEPSTRRILQPQSVAEQAESYDLVRETFSSSHGMDTMDAKGEQSRARKKLLMSRHFLFAKAEFNVVEEGSMVEDARMLNKSKGKNSSELFTFDKNRTFPVKAGLDLNSLEDSMAVGEMKDTKEFKISSSETKTKDLDAIKKYHVPGVVASSSNKKFPMFQPAINPFKEVKQQIPRPNLLDMNRLPIELTAIANSETSTSKTQSFGTENLRLNSEQLQDLKRKASDLESEPSIWVKRLKLSTGSASGTQRTKRGDAPSHEKVNHIFRNIMKLGRPHVEDLIQLDPQNGKNPSSDYVRKNRDVVLTHPWIRRLCQNSQFPNGKSNNSELSNESMDKNQPKQFASLGAMALMGRIMGKFSTCELAKNGSTASWNA